MAQWILPKLNCMVRLQKKTYTHDDLGGRDLKWEDTDQNEYWADIQPVGARYILDSYDRKIPNPKMYDVIMEDIPHIYISDKIIWSPTCIAAVGSAQDDEPSNQDRPVQELLYMCSPQRLHYAEGRIAYVRIRVLSWQTAINNSGKALSKKK